MLNKVNFVHLDFYIGKVRPYFQIAFPQEPLDRLNIYASREQKFI